MQQKRWIKGLALSLLLASTVGCSANGAPDAMDGERYGTNQVEIGGNMDFHPTPRFDNKNIDVDGDGDREHLSGRNDINNPSIDLRSLAHPSGGSDMTQGVYPHTFTADRIADLARSVNGVANARALIVGQTAVLGVNLERGVKSQQKDEIVQLIRQRIQVQAPEFQRVHISTERRLNRRIYDLNDEIRSGHSLSMFNDDFMDLTRQIPPIAPNAMPAVPSAGR